MTHEDLDGPVATTTLIDCRLAFYRQRRSGDVCVITSGPRGTIGHRLLEARMFDEVRRWMAAEERPRARLDPKRTTARIDDRLVGIQRRGTGIQLAFALEYARCEWAFGRRLTAVSDRLRAREG